MARINIEDYLDADKRFFKLALALGSQELAMGAMVYAWRLAQRYWKTDTRLIPAREFHEKVSFADQIIKSGMATLIEDEALGSTQDWIYVCGTDEQFKWILEKQEAGRKGGARSGESRSKQNEANPSKTKQTQAQARSASKTKPPLSSVPVPLSSSQICSSEEEGECEGKSASTAEESVGKGQGPSGSGEPSSPIPTKGRFPVLAEFADNSTLKEVLCQISPEVQKKWVQRYQASWLKTVLLNAISYHIEKENAENAAQINDWGLRLGQWVRREKKPHLTDSEKKFEDPLDSFVADFSEDGGMNHEN